MQFASVDFERSPPKKNVHAFCTKKQKKTHFISSATKSANFDAIQVNFAQRNSVKGIQESFRSVLVLPLWILWVKGSWAQQDGMSTVGKVRGTRQGLRKGSF